MNYKNGLVIEGGGLRGVFASGVVDGLLKKDIMLEYVIGTSMGACNGANYVSRQYKRAYNTTVKYANDKRYMGMEHMIKNGSYFNMDFIYDKLPYTLEKFDFQEFKGNDIQYKMVLTNLKTGKAEYFDKYEGSTLKLMQASTSLPFMSKKVLYKENYYLDGGIADSIPVKKAIEDGVDKVIIILTRDKDYRKEPSKSYKLGKLFYSKYPNFNDAMRDSHEQYNSTLDYKEGLDSNKVLVIRPDTAINIKRVEKDTDKLDAVYKMGMDYVDRNYTKILKFLNN
jgi:predicted patatin/cPLA2 family phospholipase